MTIYQGNFFGRVAALAAALLFFTSFICRADMQLVSALDGSTPPSASANGDSYLPVMTPDGRYVLFASSANNLVSTNANGAVPGQTPHKLNLYLRDRTSQTTVLVSANISGDGANWDSIAAGISTNGQYVLFESEATDLVSNDNNSASDVFVRDVVNGTTTLVSVNTNGVPGNGGSRSSVMTPDGRYAAFASDATDLVANDTNGMTDIFVRDLMKGTTTLASVGAMSTQFQFPFFTPQRNGSDTPLITPDGRYVAFFSMATNLVPAAHSAGEVYVRDLVTGTTIWASTNAHSLFKASHGTTNALSCNQLISDDGQFVVFEAYSSDPFYLLTSSGLILRHNIRTGITAVVTTNAYGPVTLVFADLRTIAMTPDANSIAYLTIDFTKQFSSSSTFLNLCNMQAGTNFTVSVDQNGNTPGVSTCDLQTIDPTGRYVAFLFSGTDFLTTNAALNVFSTHLYMRDVQTGVTHMIDLNTNGVGIGAPPSGAFAMSADAQHIAFDQTDSSLAPNDGNNDSDVFIRDLGAGENELVSVCMPNIPAQYPDSFAELFTTSVSTNSRYIAFSSEADNLTLNDTNRCRDVFVRDLLLQTNILVSVSTNGMAGISQAIGYTSGSTEPSISGNGRFVAFSSWATNLLVSHDPNACEDVFVRDLQLGTNYLVSMAKDGGFGNAASHLPVISTDGGSVLYRSLAQNLTTNGFVAGTENLFFRNIAARTNYALTTGSVFSSAMTPDGHYVAFIGVAPGLTPTNVYVWDSQARARIYTNSIGRFTNVAISADGRWVAFGSGLNLQAFDRIGKTNYVVGAGPIDARAGLQFSADDRFLLYVSSGKVLKNDTNGIYDVYLHDFQTGSAGTNILISHSYNSTNAANGPSYSPTMSPDGRFVAYESYASNIVPGDTNNLPDLFLYDRLSSSTTLVTVNLAGTGGGNNLSEAPIFTGDGSNLVFVTYASNLPGAGFNQNGAIFTISLTALAGGPTGGDGSVSNSLWSVQFLTQPAAGQYPTLTWPAVAGGSYQVQYKTNLDDPMWQNLNGSTVVGGQGQVTDFYPASQRFYRVVLGN